MAAVYLHNALFQPEPLPSPSYPFPPSLASHGRHISSNSLGASTTQYSISDGTHTTEPLLSSSVYLDTLSRQPDHPTTSSPAWNRGLNLTQDYPATLPDKEHETAWTFGAKRKSHLLRPFVVVSGIIIGLWAIYNTVRYFLTFTQTPSRAGQFLCLSLGISTLLSFSLQLVSSLLSAFRPQLSTLSIAPHFLAIACHSLDVLSSFFLLAPCIVNLVFVFLWRHSGDSYARLLGRCQWDIDVAWSLQRTDNCSHHVSWGVWLASGISRLVITGLILALFLGSSTVYTRSGRPRGCLNPRSSHLKQTSAEVETRHRPWQTRLADKTLPSRPDDIHLSEDPAQEVRRIRSSSSVSRTTLSRASSRPRVRSTGSVAPPRSSSHEGSDENSSGSVLLARRRSTSLSSGATPPHNNHSRTTTDSGSGGELSSDADLQAFVDRFRSMVNQIAFETDEAISYARSRSASPPDELSAESSSLTSPMVFGDPYSDTSTPPRMAVPLPLQQQQQLPAAYRTYDEYRTVPIPQEIDDQVPVLGSYVRRMPTIESLGSHERTSIGASSILSSRAGGGPAWPPHSNWSVRSLSMASSRSRPPTRMATLSPEPAAMAQGTAVAAGGEVSPSSSSSFPSRTSSLDHHSSLSKQESLRSMNNNNSHGTSGSGSGASAITAHTGSIRSLVSLGSVRSEMYSINDAVDRSFLTRNSSASSGTGGGGEVQASVSSRSTAETSFHTATSMDEEIV